MNKFDPIFSVENKTAIITGASSGLGRDLAYTFAERKNNLILVSRDEKDLIKY